MKTAVLTLTHNCLALTKKCLDSVRKQDVPADIMVFDNGSTDGTEEWLNDEPVIRHFAGANLGVSIGWNYGLSHLFLYGAESVLVLGNDTVIAPWTLRILLSLDLPFVTGVAVDNMEQALQAPAMEPLTPNPDFSMFCIRKDAWEKIGKFDENMRMYAQDCEYHLRAHRRGVRLLKSPVPFYHERSSTLRLASPEERAEIEAQANKDRAFLYQKWGCVPGTKKYEEMFTEDKFGKE